LEVFGLFGVSMMKGGCFVNVIEIMYHLEGRTEEYRLKFYKDTGVLDLIAGAIEVCFDDNKCLSSSVDGTVFSIYQESDF
jgi:hypothetical protein